jgi:outer membrane protein assembly factor BamB
VFAGGCGSISAYEAGQGTLYWSITPGEVLGLSVANGVLYGCVVNNYEGQLFAYDASYGGLLWSGGGCTGAPVVANGTVYGALADISAYALAGSNSNLASRKPAPSRLTPNLRLKPQATPDNVSAC